MRHWGAGYFGVNAHGHVTVLPHRKTDAGEVDLHALVKHVHGLGLSLPVLVRFTDILRDRVASLADAFNRAMDQHSYNAHYTPVYPIKVNQQRSVVDAITGSGKAGLECGSKPELMAILGAAPAGDTIVCNGYKDRGYIRLALIGQALGFRLFIVVEKLSELNLLLDEASAMDIKPHIGLRVRLATLGRGKWQNTGGEKSKFGLSAVQVLTALEQLREKNRMGCLQLLHCHLGSQVADIEDIRRGMQEVARYYAELQHAGAPITVVDVGGGLSVDYDGSRSRHYFSMNYALEEYADTIVSALSRVADEQHLPCPDIFSESGRALTAHHAVLITNVIDVETVSDQPPAAPDAKAPTALHELWAWYTGKTPLAAQGHTEIRRLLDNVEHHYSDGTLNLAQRAHAERIYQACCRTLREQSNDDALLNALNEKLADKYFCNLSIFQSLPDVWGIEQLFPILPIHRLDEPLTHRAALKDITCDSDGRIDAYVSHVGTESTLPVHAPNGEPYLLGFFLVGAYQETLGDMHNLFGDTNVVNVELDGQGGWQITETERGDTASELLQYVHYDTTALLARYRQRIEAAGLAPAQQKDYLQALTSGLVGYTYLEK